MTQKSTTKLSFRFEFSAGGIVTRIIDGSLSVLLTQHSGHKGWGFPKGHIEKGEKKEGAALREVREEGGVEGRILKEAGTTEYFFKQSEVMIKKKVYYYLMEYVNGDIANHDWEVMDAKWVSVSEVTEVLSFPSDKKIFAGIEKELVSR